MKNSIPQNIRRVEILSRVINGEEAAKADYAYEYDVESITINRDLGWLRKHGIQIFSRKNKIIILDSPPKQKVIQLIAEYLLYKLNSEVFLRQLKIFSKQKDIEYLAYLTLLAKAVNERKYITISYRRKDNEVHEYQLKPIHLFNQENNWKLLAFKDNETILKNFYVSRMLKVSVSDKKFKLPLSSEDKKGAVNMVFRFPPDVASEIFDKTWFEEYKLLLDDLGNVTLETNQEITNHLAAWCISWWDKIEILEPVELKKHIQEMFEYYIEKNKV